MPKPKQGAGPWGEAILLCLNQKNLSQADLVRLLRDPADDAPALPLQKGARKPRSQSVQAKTLSRICRGFHTHSRMFERIAVALDVSLSKVLVAPWRTMTREDKLEIAQVAVSTSTHALLESLNAESDEHVRLLLTLRGQYLQGARDAIEEMEQAQRIEDAKTGAPKK